jgi:hypothetical protein
MQAEARRQAESGRPMQVVRHLRAGRLAEVGKQSGRIMHASRGRYAGRQT